MTAKHDTVKLLIVFAVLFCAYAPWIWAAILTRRGELDEANGRTP